MFLRQRGVTYDEGNIDALCIQCSILTNAIIMEQFSNKPGVAFSVQGREPRENTRSGVLALKYGQNRKIGRKTDTRSYNQF